MSKQHWQVTVSTEERFRYNSAGIMVAWAWCRDNWDSPLYGAWHFDGNRFIFWESEQVTVFALKFDVIDIKVVDA